MSEINMVPLIDIVLVLLVLLILAAPMAAQSVNVKLPKTRTTQLAQEIKSINIYLQPDGEVTDEQGNPFEWTSFANENRDQRDVDQLTTVRIWSDETVRYVHLAKLIVDLREQGHEHISLMTRR